MDELCSQRQAQAFMTPPDPAKDPSLPGYLEVVRQPMDLGTIKKRLRDGYYEPPLVITGGATSLRVEEEDEGGVKPEEEGKEEEERSTKGQGPRGVLQDVRLVWANCER